MMHKHKNSFQYDFVLPACLTVDLMDDGEKMGKR
jgi:hypothetical protein